MPETLRDRFDSTTNPLTWREKLSILPEYSLYRAKQSGIITNKLPEFIVGTGIGIASKWGTRETLTAAGLANLPAAVATGFLVGGGISAVRQYLHESESIPALYPDTHTTIFSVSRTNYDSRYRNRRGFTVLNQTATGDVVLEQRESRFQNLLRKVKNEYYRSKSVDRSGSRRIAIAFATGAMSGAMGALLGYTLTEAVTNIPWNELTQRLPTISLPKINLPEIQRPDWWPFREEPPFIPPRPPDIPEPTPIPTPEPPPPYQITIPADSTISEQLEEILRTELGRAPTPAETTYLTYEFLRENPSIDPKTVMPGTSFNIENLRDEIAELKQQLPTPEPPRPIIPPAPEIPPAVPPPTPEPITPPTPAPPAPEIPRPLPPIPDIDIRNTITVPTGSTIWQQISIVLQEELGRPPTNAEIDFVVDEFLAENSKVDPRRVLPGTTFDIRDLHDEINQIKNQLPTQPSIPTPEPQPLPPIDIRDTITIPAGSTIWQQISIVLQEELGRPPTNAEIDFVVDEFLAENSKVDPRRVLPGTTFDIRDLHDEINSLKNIKGGGK